MIEAICGGCNSTFSVEESHAGKTGKCRKCGASVNIPSPTDSKPRVLSHETAAATEEDYSDSHSCQITTTELIQGWTIKGYKGLVTAHVVAGTGFFSDFAAGWTDVFGGRSQTYQRQMAVIEEDALEFLRSAAVDRGANWVIGTRIAFDEISGKGMQMFMVSAQGTAVRAVADPSVPHDRHAATTVPGASVANRLQRDAVLEMLPAIEKGERLVTEDFVAALCETKPPEAIPLCLRLLCPPATSQVTEKIQRLARQSLHMAPRQATRQAIQNLMLSQPTSAAVSLYNHLGLLDLKWALTQVQSPHSTARQAGLWVLCCCVAASYAPDDIPVLRSLSRAIRAGIPETCTEVALKGLLSGKSTKAWRCGHGHDNSLEDQRCAICDIDRHGLPRECSVSRALQVVESTCDLLEQALRH